MQPVRLTGGAQTRWRVQRDITPRWRKSNDRRTSFSRGQLIPQVCFRLSSLIRACAVRAGCVGGSSFGTIGTILIVRDGIPITCPMMSPCSKSACLVLFLSLPWIENFSVHHVWATSRPPGIWFAQREIRISSSSNSRYSKYLLVYRTCGTPKAFSGSQDVKPGSLSGVKANFLS
ncbi:hypothetical protein VTN96DRAFT_4337 [Rasamsonia emersonii]